MLGPLGLLALILGSKKRKSKYDVLLFVLVFAVVSGVTLSACGGGGGDGNVDPPQSETSPPAPPSETPTPGGGSGGNGSPSTPGAPIDTPSDICNDIAPPTSSESEIAATIKDLLDYVFGAGNSIQSVSANSNRTDVEQYLRRLMVEAGIQGLNTNHLAYIYATTHIESRWGDFEEQYDGDPNVYFRRYDGILGNTQPGDGYRYMGRGFIHLTGRENYQRISQVLGLGTDLVDFPWKAACGGKCGYNYDYVTKIAVTGMTNGVFTGRSLLDVEFNNPDGSYNFYAARAIINWPGATSGATQRAAELGQGYAKILSEHCPLGGVSPGLNCVICR